MKTSFLAVQIAKANLLDLIRRDKFFLMLLATIAFVVGAVPPPSADHTLVVLGKYRLLYNSAWIGTLVAIITSVMLGLPGFFLLRGSIWNDKVVGINRIFASAHVGRLSYILGKFLSNVAVLSVIALSSAITAIILQLEFGEEPYIHVWSLLAPFILITFPCLVAVAALSVAFDTVRGLTGYFGGAVFLTIWASVLLLSIYPSKNSGSFIANPDKDVLGMSTTLTSIVTEIKEQHRDYREQVYFGLTVKNRNIIEEPVRWEGIEWTMNGMFPRILWMGGSFIFMIASGLIFFRFDPAREPRKKADALVRAQTSYRVQEINIIFPVVQKYITPMFSLQRWYRFKTMFIVEMKKMVKDTAWWWFLGMAILIVVCAVSPFDIMREWLLPTAWIWPLFVWSKLGMRVSGHFRNRRSNPDAQYDSLFMQVLWVMGVLVTMAAGSGAAARFILAGDWPTLFAWIICAGFIPSLSFVLSIWTASSYVFEGTYVLLWLVGSVSKQPLLDFMGTLQDSIAVQNPFLYFIWTIALITFAAVGKQRLLEK